MNIMKKIYVYKFENLDEIHKFLESHKLPKLTQEKIDNPNSTIFIKEIKFVVPTKKTAGPHGFTGELWQTFKKEVIAILYKCFHKIEMKRLFPNYFIRPVLSWYQNQAKTLQEKKTPDKNSLSI